MRTLRVTLNDRVVGMLSEGDDFWRFEYGAGWAAAADSFDLSPSLPRSQRVHLDGGSLRPVQWYFDNLLPEEQLREAVSKEARLQGEDAFALLEYLGAESAGSLVMLPPDPPVREPGGLRPLPDGVLCARIRGLPRVTLSHDSPKRMSVAGAQHKLPVVYRHGQLFEPVGSEPSTHILKPNHPSGEYPSSVVNEYLAMNLALQLRLKVPRVWRHYTPEPVYIVERFDRHAHEGQPTQRLHIIDACQLLNKPRNFKYRAATLETLADIVELCLNKASTRLRLYLWLVFNVLIGNHDNHLKNLSFNVTPAGIELAPAYDLLSTALYTTRAFANDRATWPAVEMAIALPGAPTFAAVTRAAVVQAGRMLGLTQGICERELGRLLVRLPKAFDSLALQLQAQAQTVPQGARPFLAGEARVVRAMKHLVLPDMMGRVA